MQEIRLDVRGGKWGVQLDVKEFPIFCPACKNYFVDSYKHTGSRYGQVDNLDCKCGETLSLVDSDNIVEYIRIFSKHSKITLDFKELFCLTEKNFDILKANYKYDIYKLHLNERLYLEDLIEEIELKFNFEINPYQPDFPANEILCKWLGLIKNDQQIVTKKNVRSFINYFRINRKS